MSHAWVQFLLAKAGPGRKEVGELEQLKGSGVGVKKGSGVGVKCRVTSTTTTLWFNSGQRKSISRVFVGQ